jgi:hypothetical protein
MATSATLFDSKLYPDIADVIKEEKGFTSDFKVEVKLHTELLDLGYKDGILIENLSIYRDYTENIGDYIEVQLSIPMGTFIYDVYDYLTNIEVTLIFNKQKNNVTNIERYKAVYLLDKNKAIPNNINYNKDDLNNQMPLSVTLQLLDRSVETLRIKTTQGNFDKVVNKNTFSDIASFFKSIISEQANKILVESKPILDGIHIEDVDNKDSLKSVTIPSKTRVIEIPKLILEKNIGVYTGGIGVYVQKFTTDFKEFKKYIFIYSLFNSKKYDTSDHKVIFYSPVNNSASSHNYSYKYEDNILKVLTLSITNIEDAKESRLMSYGSGFRLSNANSYMKKPVIITDKGIRFKKDQLVTEIVSKERADGLNFAVNKGVGSNQFSVMSEILERDGSYVDIQVNNLDADLIPPGAKCKIMYEGKEDIDEIYGVIHSVYTNYTSQSNVKLMNYNNPTVSLTTNTHIRVFITNF